jgi:hypothetical protein
MTLEAKYTDKLHQGNAKGSIYGQFYISQKNLNKAITQARQMRNEYLLSVYLDAQTMSDQKKMKILQRITKYRIEKLLLQSIPQCY